MVVNYTSDCSSKGSFYSSIQWVVLWSNLCTARVSLIDAAMCMNLKNDSWFNTVISYVILQSLWFSIMQTQLHFICLTGNLQKGVVRLNWVAKWVAAWKRFRGSMHFHLKNVSEPIEYSRWLPLPCFNKFVLTVLFVTKQYQPFCVRTGGDALVKVPCSGLLPSIEVGLCYLRKWRRGKSLLFILKQAQSM